MKAGVLESFHGVALAGVGMVTSLGRDGSTSCASARAGITRIRELPDREFAGDAVFSDRPPKGHSAGLTQGLRGTARLLSLGIAALEDLANQGRASAPHQPYPLAAPFPPNPPSPTVPAGTAFFLLLPDRFLLGALGVGGAQASSGASQVWRDRCAPVPGRMLEGAGLDIAPERRHLVFGGAAEAARLLSEAMDWIRAGKSRCCLVGGADSFLDPDFFKACAARGLWSTEENTLLRWPGEGACFLRIEAAGPAAHPSPLRLSAATWMRAEERRFAGKPGTGRDMSAAVLRAFGNASPGAPCPDWMLTNLCGDAFFTSDFGKAMVRVQGAHPLAEIPWSHPAGNFGDCGAAMGFMCIGIFREAVRRKYAPSEWATICLYSDNGSVAAIRLHAFDWREGAHG